jgi:hypothetical protein
LLTGRYRAFLWTAGERLEYRHVLHLPSRLAAGSYRLRARLYAQEAGYPRWRLFAEAGAVPEDSYELGVLEVTRR